MIVFIRDGRPRLEDLDNLRAFKLVAPESARSRLGESLGPAGWFEGEVAWISESWLRREAHGLSDAWTSDFEKMIIFAKTKGWYDDAAEAVRAHIEWVK